MSTLQIKPAAADCLLKAVQYWHNLSGTNRVVIQDSTIVGQTRCGLGAFRISLSEAIGNGLNLAFIYEPDKVRQFSSFRSSRSDILIFDRGEVYDITNKITSVRLWKTVPSNSGPVFQENSAFNPVGVAVSIPDLDAVRKLTKTVSFPYAYLNLSNDQLISVTVPGGSPYFFDPAAYDEKDESAGMEFKSLALPMLPGKEATLRIGELAGTYWLVAEMQIGLGATVAVQEELGTRKERRRL